MTRAMGNGVVADAHNDLLMAVHHLGHDRDYFRRVWLPQLHEGGVGLQVLPVYVDEVWIPESALRQTLRLVETALEMIERCSDEVALCLKPGNVEEALRRLRPEHRAVVHDIYFRNLPGREVAARLGIPEGTVRSRLFYALRSLRLVLEEMGWEQ